LADTQSKLVTTSQEKQRLTDALSRETALRAEQGKQLDAKIKVAQDEAKRKLDEVSRQLEAATVELEAARADNTDQKERAQRAQADLAQERDRLKTTLGGQVETQNQKIQELTALLQANKADSKKSQDELFAKYSKLDAKFAQLNQEAQIRVGDLEAKHKEAQTQLTTRARKIQELEQALENMHSAKVRVEKDVNARAAAAEIKANEALVRLSVLQKERKEIEARTSRKSRSMPPGKKPSWSGEKRFERRRLPGFSRAFRRRAKRSKCSSWSSAGSRTKRPPLLPPPPCVRRPSPLPRPAPRILMSLPPR
jgi:ParB family chromosome partitioning protein